MTTIAIHNTALLLLHPSHLPSMVALLVEKIPKSTTRVRFVACPKKWSPKVCEPNHQKSDQPVCRRETKSSWQKGRLECRFCIPRQPWKMSYDEKAISLI
jgi:hypothetical protein